MVRVEDRLGTLQMGVRRDDEAFFKVTYNRGKIMVERIGSYSYKGKDYESLGECKMKLDGDWVDGVVYIKSNQLYVRLAKDFDEKFELIPYQVHPNNMETN